MAAAVVLIAAGPWLVPLLYGAEFEVERLLFVGLAAFLFAGGWRQVNRYLLIGLGLLPRTALPILLGLAVGLALGVAGLAAWGLFALFWGMALGTLLIPGMQLPFLVWSKLREIEEAGTGGPTSLRQQPLSSEGAANG